MSRPLNILVLHMHSYFSNFGLNLQAFAAYSEEHLFYFHHCYSPPIKEVEEFDWDVIIIPYCTLSRRADAKQQQILASLEYVKNSSAVKVAFPQDDYLYYEILDDWLAYLDVDLIYTPISNHLDVLYKKTYKNTRFLPTYTSYIDDDRDAIMSEYRLPFKDRPIQFGNRINSLSPICGKHGMIKGQMNEVFSILAMSSGMVCDISTRHVDRFHGEEWLKFLGRTQFTVASKGGSSLADPDGTLSKKITQYKIDFPDSTFKEIEASCFPGQDGLMTMDAIGPRILQAAQMGVCQILLEDDYPGNLIAGEDYIAAKPGLSNIDSIFEQMGDLSHCKEIALNGRRKIMATKELHFSHFISSLMSEIEAIGEEKGIFSKIDSKITRELRKVIDKLEASSSEEASKINDSSPHILGLLGKAINSLDNTSWNTVLSIINNAEQKNYHHTISSLRAIGFDMRNYTSDERSLVLSYFALESSEERRELKEKIENKEMEDLGSIVKSSHRHNYLIKGDVVKDLIYNKPSTQFFTLVNLAQSKKKTVKQFANHALIGKPLHMIHDIKKISSRAHKTIKRRQVLYLTDDLLSGHPKFLLNALHKYGTHNYISVNPVTDRNLDKFNLQYFDAIFIDYSILLNIDHFISQTVKEKLYSFSGPIGRCQQDEYRWVKDVVSETKAIEPSFFITSLNRENFCKVYGEDFASNRIVLTNAPGFLPEEIMPKRITPLKDRKFVISGRTWDKADFKPYYGKFMFLKQQLSTKLLEAAVSMDLPVDIEQNTNSRVYGLEWGQTLMNSRGHLALEGGSSMFDLNAEFETKYENFIKHNPYKTREEIYDKVFSEYENNIIHKVMTPRCIEAAALGTVIVGAEGEYSGWLEAEKDYLVLEPDGSNSKDVLKQLMNDDLAEEIASNAKAKIANGSSLTYKGHVRRLDLLIDSFFNEGKTKKHENIMINT